jgi:hypothetical protein
MTVFRTALTAAALALLALALYLSIALPLLQDDAAWPDTPKNTAATEHRDTAADKGASSESAVERATPAPQESTAGNSNTRLLEIYGRVVDSRGQPVDSALVTEERYFLASTSDVDGYYRIRLELPSQRLPILHFLRAGYRGERIKLTQAQLADRRAYPLDIVLADSADTLRLSGWVANDLGVGLAGVRIEISALESDAEHDFYLTVFSDERGEFVLEGVRAKTRYKLTAMLAPEYPIYSDLDFRVGDDPERLEIVLPSLQFVNLAGMIRNAEAAPVGNFELYVKNISTEAHVGRIVSDSSGYFTLQQFPLGEISLTSRGPEFHKISGITLTAENYASLVLLVDRGDRFLSGWVSDDNDVALEKAMVTLDARSRDGAVEYSSYRSQTTDGSGRFAFDNLAAGEYRISVYANGFDKFAALRSLSKPSDEIHVRLRPAEQVPTQ